MTDPFEYENLVEDALRGVVKTALKQVQEYGLIDDHHFFITFHTDFLGVEIPDYLRDKYPDEMTIVLQYQFEDLSVEEDQFSVSLSFNNVPERMIVPFDSITGFADPSVKFGLQFHVAIDELDLLEDDLGLDEDGGFSITEVTEEANPSQPAAAKKDAKKPAAKGAKGGAKSSAKGSKSKKEGNDSGEDNVVSLDQFRKS